MEVELPKFKGSGFVLLDLEPLSQDQQDKCVQLQLRDNDFYDHLRKFSDVRTKQDELYATMDDASRATIEEVRMPDLFMLQEGEGQEKGEREGKEKGEGEGKAFDPKARQRNLQGGLIAANHTGELESAHLRNMSMELAAGRDEETQEKLAALATKQGVKDAELWKEVLACTDQMYAVAEVVLPAIEAGVQGLCKANASTQRSAWCLHN